MNRKEVLLFALLVACPAAALADKEDAALAKACPGLTAWAAVHPHGSDAAASTDAGRRISQPALREALARRAAADVRARDAAVAQGAPDPAAMHAVLKTDAGNLAWLKELVARQGFPTVAQVGARGVADAWLLAQHADRDSAFQWQVLRTLQTRGEQAGAAKQELAMLTDRVLLAGGKPQRYGTQFAAGEDGKLQMQPVADRDGLDARRSAMGLMPLALYRCVLGASYHLPVAQ